MIIAYLVILIIGSELQYSISVLSSMKLMPYQFGINFFSIVFYIFALASSIWYCGWIVGIIIFLLCLFGIIHGTLSWILSVPFLNVNVQKEATFLARIWGAFPIAAIIFQIVSFFITSFQSITSTSFWSFQSLIIVLIIMIVGFVIRFFYAKHVKKVYPEEEIE
jgi:hypothetical protein